MITIIQVVLSDIGVLQELYFKHLTKYPSEPLPAKVDMLAMLQKMIDDKDYYILVAETDGIVVASVTLVVIKNLTHSIRPYSIIEN